MHEAVRGLLMTGLAGRLGAGAADATKFTASAVGCRSDKPAALDARIYEFPVGIEVPVVFIDTVMVEPEEFVTHVAYGVRSIILFPAELHNCTFPLAGQFVQVIFRFIIPPIWTE